MSTPRWLLLCAVSIGVTAWLTRSPATPAAPATPAPSVASAKNTVTTVVTHDDGLAASVAELQAQVKALSASQPAPAPDVAAETPEEAQLTMSELANRFDTALDGEARDPAWDAQMQERVGSFFASAPGSHVLQIDCRASLCRVDVGVDDLMAREDLARRSPDMLEEGAEMFGYVDSPDDLEISLYLSRGGTGLPAM